MLSILFSRVTVNVLVFVLRIMCFLSRSTCTMLDVGILRILMTEVSGTGNDSIVQKQYCVVEEITEVELRSCRGKFIYNRTYNSVG